MTACKVKIAETCSSDNRFYLLFSANSLEKIFSGHLNQANLIQKKQLTGIKNGLWVVFFFLMDCEVFKFNLYFTDHILPNKRANSDFFF